MTGRARRHSHFTEEVVCGEVVFCQATVVER